MLAVGFARGWAAGEREEHVVEVRGVDREAVDVDVGVIEFAQYAPQRRDVAIGRNLQGQRVFGTRGGVQDARGRTIRGGVSERELDVAARNARLELGGRTLRDEASAVEDCYVVGELVGFLQVLGGEEHGRSVAHQAADDLPHCAAAARV